MTTVAVACEYRANVQCTEASTGKVGTFIAPADSREAVSPVFSSLAQLYPWMRENGWRFQEGVGQRFVPWRVVKEDA